ncbi:MAG: patatin family protein [Firmicutes bacterium]|nr:patatin family protein [Bacillota bacterium]
MGKPLVGIALGGGAARGLAHIGVLATLEEAGVPLDIVTGTSIGAIVGGYYAAGGDLEWLAKLVLTLKWDQLVDLTVPRLGFLKTEKLYHLLQLLCRQKKIEELEIKFGAVAVDIANGEELLLTSGDIAAAAIASASIPGVFLPYKMNDRLLVDGGIRSQIPIEAAKKLGADLVIAVDVSGDVIPMKVQSVIDVMLQSVVIMQEEANAYKIRQADVLITPAVGAIRPFDLSDAAQTIELGRTAAREKLPEIFAALDKVGRSYGSRKEHGDVAK